jgi:simple sugar transport system substrate-binding protein
MSKKVLWKVLGGLLAVAFLVAACAPKVVEAPAAEPAAEEAEAPAAEAPAPAPVEPEEFIFGMLLVGPYNDHGWSQAHYDAGLYVEENVPGAKMVYLDKVNVADRPGTTPAQLGEELVSKGAKLVIFNSDDMKDSAHEFALANPDVFVVHASGDGNWVEGKDYKNIPNLANIMGKMEYGKMIAGCAAAMTSTTGKIGYLGPLINEETRRLASSVYLGAQYCWENYAKKDPAKLTFEVNWIGFWFNIPGFTSDPTQVADDFFNKNFDVVISGIDTTEALTEAVKMRADGKNVFAIPYDYMDACSGGADACLGVPYFNWGPAYVEVIKAAKDSTFKPFFTWNAPDWADINNPDTSAVGFVNGNALSADAAAVVDTFVAELASGLNLWKGPLNLQDGIEYLADGETATDYKIWYLPQLLEGMVGLSTPAE